MRKLYLLVAISSLALATRPAAAQGVLTFEDIPCGNNTVGVYDGVDFGNVWMCYNDPQAPYNAASGTNRVYSIAGQSAEFTFAPTGFAGAYFAGNYDVSFSLYNAGSLVGTSETLALSGTPTFLSSGYSGPVDRVVVNGTNDFYVMDDVTFNATTTPEPSAIALLGTGIVGLVPVVRRRRK